MTESPSYREPGVPSDPTGSPDLEDPRHGRRNFLGRLALGGLGVCLAAAGISQRSVLARMVRRLLGSCTRVPIRNPAFSFCRRPDGSVMCWATTTDGKRIGYTLNDTAAFVWLRCTGRTAPETLSQELASSTGSRHVEAQTAVAEAIRQLEGVSLLVGQQDVKVTERRVERQGRLA